MTQANVKVRVTVQKDEAGNIDQAQMELYMFKTPGGNWDLFRSVTVYIYPKGYFGGKPRYEVNWSAIGSVPAKEAKTYGEAICIAAEHAQIASEHFDLEGFLAKLPNALTEKDCAAYSAEMKAAAEKRDAQREEQRKKERAAREVVEARDEKVFAGNKTAVQAVLKANGFTAGWDGGNRHWELLDSKNGSNKLNVTIEKGCDGQAIILIYGKAVERTRRYVNDGFSTKLRKLLAEVA